MGIISTSPDYNYIEVINMMGEINPEAIKLQQLQLEKDKLLKEIIQDIFLAKTELATATQNYNFADSDDLIDLCSYRIITAQAKYNFLLKKAKENGLSYQQYLHDSVKVVRR